MHYDNIDNEIVRFLQGDIPLVSNPWADLAKSMDISENELLERIRSIRTRGIMRRWGAVLRHQKAGYNSNAMVAWRVNPDNADQAGEKMAGMKEISHCYLREVPDDFKFELFSMIHARDEQELINTINRISKQTGLNDYAVLRSVREFKKVSMKYVL